jgi:hypothetical protein
MRRETTVAELLDRPVHGGYPPAAQRLELDRGLVAALAWCRLGSSRTPRPWPTDADFYRAEALGFLRHHPTWHATAEGEGVLIAAGLLSGKPAPEQITVHVLWATCERYRRPQFVAAWSDGLVDAWSETYRDQRAEAERQFAEWGDERDWTFWTTVEHLDAPAIPERSGTAAS